MEFRSQTYLGAVQLIAVLAGSLILRAIVHGVDSLLMTNHDVIDPLRYLRPLGSYGWVLLLLPVAWVFLTIQGERSDCRWATRPLIIGSGIVLLLGMVALFGWAGWVASSIVF